MRNHIPLGRLFGIRIWLSRWVLYMIGAIALWKGMQDPGFLLPTLLWLATVAGIVLLHELGHSVVAKSFGVKVSHITLMPLGGVAWMEEIPEDPKIEGLIAIAGPAVNLLLALLALPFLFLFPADANAFALSPADVLANFIVVNLMLGCFNLIPAFPMDGGRILRAFFGLRMDWLAATEKAVGIGKKIAIVGGLLGLFGGLFILPLVAGYVWFMGQRELFTMRARKLGSAFPFGGFGQPGASPPRDEGDASDFPRQASEATGERRGFSAAEIERLESYRGPLKRDWQNEE